MDEGGSEGASQPCSVLDNVSFFHTQPASLSIGYEKGVSPLGEEAYANSDLPRKICIKRRLKCPRSLFDLQKHSLERKLRNAVSVNDIPTVMALLQKGVSADCYDSFRRSPLHIASCKGYKTILRLLLLNGANPNGRDFIGNTPLHLAACTNHIDVVMCLLQAGSDGLSIDKLGRSPLQLALSKLKILQKSSVTDGEVKNQVSLVIELLLLFSRDGTDSEKLSKARDRMKDATSREQVDLELGNLLDSIGSLSIS